MTVFPDRRLVRAASAWTGATMAVVLWPPLWPVLLAALAVLAALVVWDARLLGAVPPLALARRLPARAFVGREAEITVQLGNAHRDAVEVDLVDDPPPDLTPVEPRFAGVRVGGGERVTLRYTVRPSARGDRLLGPLVALERSPLGFLRRRVVGAGAPLRVYPDVTRLLRPEALDPRRVFAAIGVRRARERGEGMEFESLRDYVVGDDPRRLDWPATARRGRPVTRLYQFERTRIVLLALDASRLMGGRVEARTKLDHTVDAALALAYAALASGDRVGMVVFDREVRGHLAPRAHRRHLGLFIDFLRPLEPRLVEANYQALARTIATRQRQRALVVVMTDFVEADPASLVEPLVVLARRHRVLVVAVRERLYEVLAATAPPGPETPLGLYRRLVLDELLRAREAALAGLRHAGLQTLDLAPEALTGAVLNRYLAIRHGAAA
jgi:uncharacterized protein (DUF58 family)